MSILLGLTVNYFNPEGISLIREMIELKWAPDTLFNSTTNDTISIETDSLESLRSKIENQVEETTTDKKVIDKKENITVADAQEKTAEEKKEIVSFTEPQAITLEQAYKLFNLKVKFIDARDQADYVLGHITNSINIPFDDFDNHKQKLNQLSEEKPIVIYCAGTDCDLSILLGNLLFEQGYKQVYVFFGGWNEWLEANYPIDKSSE
jgi:rhodanese-related sulfurtransferase